VRVAIVHDWGNQIGGAEGVLSVLKRMYPDAPVYMSIYWPEAMPDEYRTWDIRTSFMNHLPMVRRHHQPFLPLYPLAFESFDLREYDLVISNKSGFCHGVLTGPETLHICYCLTPTRYLWSYEAYAQREGIGRLANLLLRPILYNLRMWDRLAAERVDHFVAISTEVQRRIAKYYRREAAVIPPPVDTSRYTPQDTHEDYFLVVSRLIPYKRIDLAVRAFNELHLPLKIVGEGRDRHALERMAGSTIEFLGHVSDREMRDLLARCRAFVFPGHDDFGIAPVEAEAAGRPVIAYASGGALDTMVEGVTGVFFHELTWESLATAVQSFDETAYDPALIRQHALKFDTSAFIEKMGRFVAEKYREHMEGNKGN
jgi:glycosyltransferase involved in cell wall biosynthesis